MDMKLLFAVVLGCLIFFGSAAPGNGQAFVYPKEGQTKAQQEKDEFECYKWAQQQTGVNPANQGQTYAGYQGEGEVIRGAARGAALGAIGGAIGGKAGKGAKIGAAVGAAGGLLRRARNRDRQRKAEAKQAKAQKRYNKAYGVCLKGRGYAVE